MLLEGTLEQDILNLFWEAGSPMNVLEVWQALDEKNIQVPLNYLAKVLESMTRFELLENLGVAEGYSLYQPTRHRFRLLRKPIKLIFGFLGDNKQSKHIRERDSSQI